MSSNPSKKRMKSALETVNNIQPDLNGNCENILIL